MPGARFQVHALVERDGGSGNSSKWYEAMGFRVVPPDVLPGLDRAMVGYLPSDRIVHRRRGVGLDDEGVSKLTFCLITASHVARPERPHPCSIRVESMIRRLPLPPSAAGRSISLIPEATATRRQPRHGRSRSGETGMTPVLQGHAA